MGTDFVAVLGQVQKAVGMRAACITVVVVVIQLMLMNFVCAAAWGVRVWPDEPPFGERWGSWSIAVGLLFLFDVVFVYVFDQASTAGLAKQKADFDTASAEKDARHQEDRAKAIEQARKSYEPLYILTGKVDRARPRLLAAERWLADRGYWIVERTSHMHVEKVPDDQVDELRARILAENYDPLRGA